MSKRGLPVYKGIVFRGVDLNFPRELLVNGGTFLDQAFLSSSFLSQTSFSDKEGDTLFIIKSKTGMPVKKFSTYDEEEEVLFRLGTLFRITSVQDHLNGGGLLVHMDEIQSWTRR
jgi:hypothetical protein